MAPVKVVLVGDPGTGKTSLALRLAESTYTDDKPAKV